MLVNEKISRGRHYLQVKSLPLLFGLSLASLVSASQARASSLLFRADLSGTNEIHAKITDGVGTATATFDSDTNSLILHLVFNNLFGNVKAAGINCCASVTGNSGVALGFSALDGMPMNVTFGTFDRTYNFATTALGTSLDSQTLLNRFLAGKAYVNIQTSFSSAGEIRGQFFASPIGATGGNIAPEPGSASLTLALFCFALPVLVAHHLRIGHNGSHESTLVDGLVRDVRSRNGGAGVLHHAVPHGIHALETAGGSGGGTRQAIGAEGNDGGDPLGNERDFAP